MCISSDSTKVTTIPLLFHTVQEQADDDYLDDDDDDYLEEKRPKVDQKHLRSRTQVKSIPGSSVLEHKCVICQTKERWMTKKGKRVRDDLIQAETLNAGNYYTKGH